MPLISALGRQRQVDLCEFEESLVYKVRSGTVKDTQINPISKKQKKEKKRKKEKEEHNNRHQRNPKS